MSAFTFPAPLPWSLSSAAAPRRFKAVVASSQGGKPLASGRRLRALRVECNELNKWASPDGGEESPFGDLDDEWNRDTMRLTVKLLTARSVQKVLAALEETSVATAQWFNNFVSQHPPLQEGETFLTGLLRAQLQHSAEVLSGCEDTTALDRVSPADLASRIMAQRSAMAVAISSQDAPLTRFVAVQNVNVLRSHVQRSTYVSGN